MNFFFITLFLISLFFFVSCEGESKDEVIEKITWVTYNTEHFKDTLVQYRITESKTDYIISNDSILHTITIKNENETYPNTFAIEFNCGYKDTIFKFEYMPKHITDSVEILPLSTHSFTYNSQAGFKYNYNNSINIIQIPKNVILNRKEDSLKIEKDTVNSLKTNIEALKLKYKTIKELYYSKNLKNDTTNKSLK